MARKRKTSLLEVTLDLVSLLPWWAGVAIAAIGYGILHRMAAPVQVTAIQPGQVGSLHYADGIHKLCFNWAVFGPACRLGWCSNVIGSTQTTDYFGWGCRSGPKRQFARRHVMA